MNIVIILDFSESETLSEADHNSSEYVRLQNKLKVMAEKIDRKEVRLLGTDEDGDIYETDTVINNI